MFAKDNVEQKLKPLYERWLVQRGRGLGLCWCVWAGSVMLAHLSATCAENTTHQIVLVL